MSEMSNPLLGSLGLDKVDGDPNNIPDGPYKGVITKSEIFVSDKKNSVNHVVTIRVTEGNRKGARKQQWFKLGTDPVRDEGPSKKLIGYTPTMTDQAKSYYKQFWMDCGVNEAEIGTLPFEALVGVDVTFNAKTKDGFQNLYNIKKRDDAPATAPGVSAPTGPAGAL